MSNENFRRELRNVFDEITGNPSSYLGDRVRASLVESPRHREPYWLAAVAAAVIAVLIVAVLFVANPLRQTTTPIGATHSPSPTASAAATPQATASAQPFVCSAQSSTVVGGSAPPPLVYVADLRTGAHGNYDRLTIQFANGKPNGITIDTRPGTTFTLSPSGMETTLKGQNGILVTIRGADLHSSYSGPLDIVTGYSGLAEVKRIQDYEGVVQLALGVTGAACYRVTWLTNPNRLVIDVQAT